MSQLAQNVKTMRVVQGAMLLSIVFFAALGEFLPAAEEAPPQILRIVLAGLAAANILFAVVLRTRLVGAAAETLRTRPADTTAIQDWQRGTIVCLAMAESVGLFGLVQKLLGAAFWEVMPFYAAGFVLLLIWTPREPS